jgi:hypothetical protein
VPPPTPARSRFGLFRRRDQRAASLGSATPTAANGEFEDLLARARETVEPLPVELAEDLTSDPDSDEPAVVIDDFDNPPLDDDPIRGSDSSDDRPPADGTF